MITFRGQLSKSFNQYRSLTTSSILSSIKDKDDDDNKKDKRNQSQEEASTKLNNLLNMMIQKEDDKPKTEVKLAQAVKHRKEKGEKEKTLGDKLEEAAKNVASSLGGDVEKTESELLNILLRRSEKGSELKNVLAGIKVIKEPTSRAEQVRDILAQKPSLRPRSFAPDSRYRQSAELVDIFGSAPSTYFKDLKPQPLEYELHTWKACVARDMRLAVTHPPANIYEQMIQWTDQGMVWKFPIDNEQGMDEERKVSFDEHVFLENHLEGWCPEKGPIRHFMELVCVGLSKNHWLTAEEKKAHIYWYRDFFAEKKSLLKEIGAGVIQVETSEQQQISK